jgi:hypothetical protein
MALLFMDGVSHYATADITKKWSSASNASVVSGGGRRGGGALTLTLSTGSITKILPSAISTVIVGFAFNANSGTSGSGDLIRFGDGATVHAGLLIDDVNMRIGCFRSGGGVFAYSANNSVPASGYIYVECKVTISDTVGTFEVRIDGATVINLTGLDTRNGGNPTLDRIILRAGMYNGGRFCDIYANDTTGSVNNNFLGDVRIDTIFPNADGTYSQFTPSTGTSHYALVDESTPNTTDYNDGANVGDRDSYAMQNLTALASQTVHAIQVLAAISKDDAGARSAATMVRSGSTNSDGTSVALSTSQGYISKIHETNPDTSSAWSETTVNALEAGAVVTA